MQCHIGVLWAVEIVVMQSMDNSISTHREAGSGSADATDQVIAAAVHEQTIVRRLV